MDRQFESLSEQYNTKRDNYYHNPRTEMLVFIPANAKRILDIGCSTGGFGAQVKQKSKDIEFWGVEPFESAAQEAELVLDKVIRATFTADLPELQGQKFDVIVFNDVLEHLIDPGSTLQMCRAFLAPGGVIVASIPNVLYFPVFFNQIIFREDWRYAKDGILDNTHLRFFTKRSILRLFDENGFSVVRIKGINALVPFYYWVFNTLLLNKAKEWRYMQYAIVASPE